jgi:hypothetical protein
MSIYQRAKVAPRRIQNRAGAFSGKVEAGLPLENAPIFKCAWPYPQNRYPLLRATRRNFLSDAYALELTVVHKTVAEPR